MTDDATRALTDDLVRAVGAISRKVRSQTSGFGELGEAAMSALALLHKAGPLTLTQLSEERGVTPGSMSQTVNRLTGAGLAVRRPDPADGRRVLFATTAVGAQLAIDARARRHHWLAEQILGYSDADRAALARAAIILDEIAAR